jgi:C4-dicarboxylate-specific signal transduction histidine kinase
LTLQPTKERYAVNQSVLTKYGEFHEGQTVEEFIDSLLTRMSSISDQLAGVATWAEDASIGIEFEVEEIREAVKSAAE